VLAVVRRGGRVLVVRRSNSPLAGRWGFPGGVLELGEGVPGDDADEVAWLSRAEIVEQGLPTAPALLPLIDLALQRR